MKKTALVILTCLLVLALISCNKMSINDSDKNIPTIKLNAENENKITDSEIITNKAYKTNDEIDIGNNSDIIKKQGRLDDPEYLRKNVILLGADSNGNIRTFNFNTSEIESIDANNKVTVLLNIMENRKDHVFAIKMLGDLVAWSECPNGNMDPALDKTNGKGWGLYFTDLKTKKITKIDGDKNITVPEKTQYSYLAPNQVFLSPNTISYISFENNPEGKVTSVIKLYTISEQKLETLDYLNEDLTQNAFGYPSVSGDKMVWCKGHVNSDGTYTGCSYLYDINTRVISKLVTDENIINPKISGKYIIAQGEPNKTFYDSEICIYDVSKNQWVFKINNGYSQYKSRKDVYLDNITTVGNYALWTTGYMPSLVLFNEDNEKLYNIIQLPSNKEINSPQLLDGGLLTWIELTHDSSETLLKYIILK